MLMRTRYLAAAVVAVFATAATTSANIIDQASGRPVDAIGSSVAAVPDAPQTEGSVSYNAATGQIDYFIPLSQDDAGVYGVTDVGHGNTAGTISDVGRGTGIGGNPALRMFLRFDAMDVPGGGKTSLVLDFADLDLDGANDPGWFTEAVQVRDASGNHVTPILDALSDTPGANDPYDFVISGDHQVQSVTVGDVSSLVSGGEPTWLELAFWSDSDRRARNTVESMSAMLQVEDASPIPEPATMVLLGLGGMVLLYRRGD